MKPTILTATLGLGLVLFGPLSVPATTGPGAFVQLRVSVFNSSPISPATIGRAESEAGRVLRDAGVEVIWLDCFQDAQPKAPPDLCSGASFPSHLHLRILQASRDLKAATVGVSFSAKDGTGCYADLFYQPIQRLEEVSHASPSVILGHAMAHELGHLLLGTNSHSPSGLMRAQWTREDLINAAKGNLRFSREQSLRIMNRIGNGEPGDAQTTVMAGTSRDRKIQTSRIR